ncbi:MAG: folate-binding protein YgfZ [Coleofasciculaceae cyanobacterium SM2_3_26]|nr:folate-binding protein YgfZ [Coleofasciculaceae cyanobacterium SM2_3_26]
MKAELQEVQTKAGASFEASVPVPVSYGNDTAALGAAQTGVALCDRSHWGRIEVRGDDRLRFLHNQSTNAFQTLQPGQLCDTVFVTSTARTVDLATAWVMPDAVLLLVSPQRRQYLLEWLDRYIFPFDKVELKDITDTTHSFSLIGSQSEALLERLGIAPPNPNSHCPAIVANAEIQLGAGSGLATPGFTAIAPVSAAAAVWQAFADAGAVPLGETAWEQLRVRQGRPAPDRELTEDYNPLEAGLWRNVSFEKGCYIGQETIARLNTYKGVKQQLWGLRLSAPAEPGEAIAVGEDKVGKLTSCVPTAEGAFGLAYIRTKAGGAGLRVRVGGVEGEVVEVPFASRGYLGEE